MRWEISIASGNGSCAVTSPEAHCSSSPARMIRYETAVIVGGIGARVIRGTTDHDRERSRIGNIRRARIDYFKHIRIQNELAVVLAHGGIDLGIRFQQYRFNARSFPLGHIFALLFRSNALMSWLRCQVVSTTVCKLF